MGRFWSLMLGVSDESFRIRRDVGSGAGFCVGVYGGYGVHRSLFAEMWYITKGRGNYITNRSFWYGERDDIHTGRLTFLFYDLNEALDRVFDADFVGEGDAADLEFGAGG